MRERDFGTAQLHEREMVIEARTQEAPARVINNSLEYYLHTERIDLIQYSAGMMLWADHALLHGNRTVLEALLNGGSFAASYSYREYAPCLAFSRYNKVMEWLEQRKIRELGENDAGLLAGARQAELAFKICIEGWTLEGLKQKLKWSFPGTRQDQRGVGEMRAMLDAVDSGYRTVR